MNVVSRLRAAPQTVRLASLLICASFALSVVSLAVDLILQGVPGPSEFRNARTGQLPSATMTVVIFVVQFAGVLLWSLLPMILLAPVARGYRWARWTLSSIAVVNLLFSLPGFQVPSVWISSVLLLVGAALLWVPDSSRFFSSASE